jgi:hypothetical protein
MKIINVSKPLINGNTSLDKPIVDSDINIIYQYFVHRDKARSDEIAECLRRNVLNPHVTRIHLLNERIYSDAELGVVSLSPEFRNKIVQVNVEKRLTFQATFQYITDNQVRGYNVIINADIFLDETIDLLRQSDLHEKKRMLALLRYEFEGPLVNRRLSSCKLFGPRMDSQDTWIIHSNFNVVGKQQKAFSFEFGKPGCDNKLVYIMNILGYEVVNDPARIKTYHYHKTQIRDYTQKDVIPIPWGVVVPAGYSFAQMPSTLGIDVPVVIRLTNNLKDIRFEDNDYLHNYIKNKLEANDNFVIPRIAGIENNYAVQGELIYQRALQESMQYATFGGGSLVYRPTQEEQGFFSRTLHVMKNNAGIRLTDMTSIVEYSRKYMRAFENCEVYSGWEPQGEVYKWIIPSHDYIRQRFSSKKVIWAFAHDIFHYIYSPNPWTHALRGKRVLIISAFVDSIRERLSVESRTRIYDGVDLFPDCTFVLLKPPQTQGGNASSIFTMELENFTRQLDTVMGDFDVALVSCGGYGNLVCDYIYKNGKSAIYIGGALQMYFGILGTRWVRERPEIVKMFLNKEWSRPKESERPANHAGIEGSCYW